MSIRVSAIICTHNRAAYLKKAIQSLVDQTLLKEQYEVIVVDNGSIDDTKAVVKSFECFKNLHYLHDSVLGLSQARNTGWQSARGEYIAYLDDDAIACPEWLERIVQAFETIKPRPGSVGGKVAPVWEANRPKWLSKQMELALTIVDWTDKAAFLTEGYQFLAGANVAYLREVLKRAGGFSTSLGRKGSSLLSNDEILLKRYLTESNLGTYYDPEIYVQHHILAERLVKRWFYRRYYWQGISNEILEYLESHQRGISLRYPYRALLNTLGFVRHPANLLAIIMPASSASQVLRKCRLYAQLGRIWAQVRIGLGLVRE